MKPNISVITCAHNPRRDYFSTVLDALKSQTLPLQQWEFLLIDNASKQLLASEIDISWHPNARHIREEKLGLTPARLRGIQEAQADILVFVDDDNVLDRDYLEVTLQISKDKSFLGAWGGQIRPKFEEQPPDWTKPYWSMLAIREFDQDKWSNLSWPNNITHPCGAGLCIRKIVAEKYAELVRNQPERAGLDRKGKMLLSCGDMDLALSAGDVGLGTGQLTSLKLTHLIPVSRFQEDYLLRLAEGMSYSHVIMGSFRGEIPHKPSLKERLLQHYRLWKMDLRKRQMHRALQRGSDLAIRELAER